MNCLCFLYQCYGTETVIEVREQIRDSIIVFQANKDHRFIERIVKTIQINKIDSILVGIINFGYFTNAYNL